MSDNSVPQPKKFNSKKYQQGYDEINWDNKIRCINCNSSIEKNHLKTYPDLYIEYNDGTVEHRQCNFN